MTDERTLLVPSSLAREAEDKREATRKLGYVARAATVFRADRLVVFPDREGERRWGGEFVHTVLEYAATPPDLRKEVWDVRDELEYVGVLPPLRVPSPTGSGPDGAESTVGIVTEVGPDDRVRVNCGMQHPVSLRVPPETTVTEGERVTVRVSSREPVRARVVEHPPPGFAVERATVPDALDAQDGVTVATSRHGAALSAPALTSLVPRVADGCTVAFGAPGRGLPDILGVPPEAVEPDVDTVAAADAAPADGPGFDLWLDTIPRQGSEVVRTEEAMFASLAALTLPQ